MSLKFEEGLELMVIGDSRRRLERPGWRVNPQQDRHGGYRTLEVPHSQGHCGRRGWALRVREWLLFLTPAVRSWYLSQLIMLSVYPIAWQSSQFNHSGPDWFL